MVDVKDMALAYSNNLTQQIENVKLEITKMEESYSEARKTADEELADLESHLQDCLTAIENGNNEEEKEGGETVSTGSENNDGIE